MKVIEVTIGLLALIVATMQLLHDVAGVGYAPLDVPRAVFDEDFFSDWPNDREGPSPTGFTDEELDEFKEDFDRMVERQFPDEPRPTPTPPDWFNDRTELTPPWEDTDG